MVEKGLILQDFGQFFCKIWPPSGSATVLLSTADIRCRRATWFRYLLLISVVDELPSFDMHCRNQVFGFGELPGLAMYC